MTEVMGVPRDAARAEHLADKFDEPDPEPAQATEVIRVGSRRATGDSTLVEPVADPEPQHKEVIRVGAPAREAIAGKPVLADPDRPQPARVTAVGGDSADRGASAPKPAQPLQEVAAIATIFSDSLRALDLVAAEQARWVLSIAESLADAARSMDLASRATLAGHASDHNDVEALVTALKRTADTQMKALTAAQAKLTEMAAGAKSDSRLNSGTTPPSAPDMQAETAVANIVSNLNLAQQNAVANQQSMNSIAQAAISAGLSLLYNAAAQPAAGSNKE